MTFFYLSCPFFEQIRLVENELKNKISGRSYRKLRCNLVMNGERHAITLDLGREDMSSEYSIARCTKVILLLYRWILRSFGEVDRWQSKRNTKYSSIK